MSGGRAVRAGTPQEIAERALAASRADGCAVIVDESDGSHLRWAGNTVTAAGHVRDHRVTVIALADGRGGTATGVVTRHGVDGPNGTGGADGDVLTGLVRAAEYAARQGGPAEDACPLPPAGGGQGSQDWSAPPATPPAEGLGILADGLRTAIGQARAEGRLLYGYAEHGLLSSYLATTSGLRLCHVQPTGLVDLTARAEDGDATSWTGMSLSDRAPDEPPRADLAAMDLRLRTRLGWARRRADLRPGRYEVLLSPSCVADLMQHLYDAAGAKDALDGRSPFSGDGDAHGGGLRIGARVAPAGLTLSSDPGAAGLECAPFVIARSSGDTSSVFDNGLPLHPTNWIADGVLTALVQTRHTARLTGLPATPRVDNLRLDGGPGGRTLAEMVAGTERGLLLTSLWYLREVDPRSLTLTGLTRDGVYLVENGEIVGATRDFRFNESPLGVLQRTVETGRTERALPREWDDGLTRAAMPPLRVGDFTVSAVSGR
ncbi:metallopeptidase TldD-related protein [Actinomadura xylanilytica]|uniref:metallopeptidase TldD-related protein n=1 Tax=Actinomadura xylanilytica TaxID=887459 RepID=UPI00255A745A|nr:metallopeptidase TldD-related protein [Actinomadura xylanilytica]MDL4776715.1 metallopeptidase TldD-related protein [Actinomadura xylanilytica]